MDKKFAFFISLAVTLLFAANYLVFAGIALDEKSSVFVSRVIDGDTVELDDGRVIRLLNVNTPEKKEFGYSEALDFMKSFENRTVYLEVVGVGKYGRTLGKIYDSEGEYINLELVEFGLASVFLADDEKLFKEVENSAKERGVGIWEKSEDSGCIELEINKKEEYIIIDNKCEVNLEGWLIKDESTKRYIFPRIDSEKVILYSGDGQDEDSELYWGAGNVWNDDKDSIFVRDKNGFLVYHDSYGY